MCNPGNWGSEEIKGEWPCVPSQYLEWVEEPQDLCIWVDCWLSPCIEILSSNIKYKVAVLVEPFELCPFNYNWILAHQDEFDLIYSTYPQFGEKETNPDKFKLLSGGARSYLHPNEWDIYPKSKNITSIVSPKRFMEGHQLRHQIKDTYQPINVIDYLNPPMDKKIDALRDYRFEVVIENEDGPFFSEKLIDSLLAGCIPLYWSSNDNKKHLSMFDENGIVYFQNKEEFDNLINSGDLNEQFYLDRIEAVKHNFEEAKHYASLGDMLWKNGIKELLGK